MRVLIVDDEADLASALAERLELRGIEADWTTNADEAVKKAAGKAYDLAVLDMKMPKTSGLELRARLQEMCPGMKFIFFTGYGSEKDYKEICAHNGETGYLIKPIDIQVLIQRMQQLLQPWRNAP